MTIQIIYAGGTFGSHGSPLKPIESEAFIPELQKIMLNNGDDDTEIIHNTIIKDSSEFSTSDFFHFYELILQSYKKGQRQFVLITGTDTLSYLGAFLTEAFVDSDICISLTASMNPLFNQYITEALIVDKDSDGWGNLQLALTTVQEGLSGVKTCFLGESWQAESVKKVHSQNLQAFTGSYEVSYPNNQYKIHNDELSRSQLVTEWINERLTHLQAMRQHVTNFSITPIFLMPNNQRWLSDQISSTVNTANELNHTAYIVLMSFGAGNLANSASVRQLFNEVISQGHTIISSTQCTFGGVNSDYQAGNWQYEQGVLSSGNLSIEAIFGRLFWLHLFFSDENEKLRLRWNQLLAA